MILMMMEGKKIENMDGILLGNNFIIFYYIINIILNILLKLIEKYILI